MVPPNSDRGQNDRNIGLPSDNESVSHSRRASTDHYRTTPITNRLHEPVTLDLSSGRRPPTDALSAAPAAASVRPRQRRPRRAAPSDRRKEIDRGRPPTAPIRIYGEGVLGLPDRHRRLPVRPRRRADPDRQGPPRRLGRDFNAALRARAERTGEPFVPFDPGADYHRYVDGRPRFDGVRASWPPGASRCPTGRPTTPASPTVHGIGNARTRFCCASCGRRGSSRTRDRWPTCGRSPRPGCAGPWSRPAPTAGRWWPPPASPTCWRSGSTGVIAKERGLRGKPHPDTFLAAAEQLGVDPARAAVFEDALAGVEAGRAGGFGFVVGVDRVGQTEALLRHGADIVVRDLAELLSADPATSGALRRTKAEHAIRSFLTNRDTA